MCNTKKEQKVFVKKCSEAKIKECRYDFPPAEQADVTEKVTPISMFSRKYRSRWWRLIKRVSRGIAVKTKQKM